MSLKMPFELCICSDLCMKNSMSFKNISKAGAYSKTVFIEIFLCLWMSENRSSEGMVE